MHERHVYTTPVMFTYHSCHKARVPRNSDLLLPCSVEVPCCDMPGCSSHRTVVGPSCLLSTAMGSSAPGDEMNQIEKDRLAELQALEILDTPAEACLLYTSDAADE